VGTNISGEQTVSINPEDVGSMFLQNICIHVPDYCMVSQNSEDHKLYEYSYQFKQIQCTAIQFLSLDGSQ
jgi:hypothetical protein